MHLGPPPSGVGGSLFFLPHHQDRLPIALDQAGPRPEGSDITSSWASFICQGGVPARERLARVGAPEPGRLRGQGGSHAARILRSLSLESHECRPRSSPDGPDPGLHGAGILVQDSASKG